ncbi:unnamed protein product, partial [Lymnaea stagnalis]
SDITINHRQVNDAETSAHFTLEADYERNENANCDKSCNQVHTISNRSTTITDENHQTNKKTYENPSVFRQGILNLIQASTLQQSLIQSNNNNGTNSILDSTAQRKESTPGGLIEIKNDVCVTECDIKENCDSFFCESKLLTESELSGNIYAE